MLKHGTPSSVVSVTVSFLDHAKPIVAVSWSRKGDFLLSASLDSSVRLYKPRRSRACLFTFAHLKPLTSVAFCPWNDMHFVTGGLDRKLRLWDVSKGNALNYDGFGRHGPS